MIPAMLTKKNLSKHTKSLQNNRKREFLEKYLEDQLEAIRTASIDEAGSSASSCTDGLTKIEVPRKKKQLKREPYLFQKSKASVEVQSKHTTNKKAFAGISTSKKGLRTPRFSKHFKQSHSEYSEHLEEGEKKDVKDMEKLEISALYESAFSENKKSATTSQRSCYEIIVVNDSASISSSSSRLTVDTGEKSYSTPPSPPIQDQLNTTNHNSQIFSKIFRQNKFYTEQTNSSNNFAMNVDSMIDNNLDIIILGSNSHSPYINQHDALHNNTRLPPPPQPRSMNVNVYNSTNNSYPSVFNYGNHQSFEPDHTFNYQIYGNPQSTQHPITQHSNTWPRPEMRMISTSSNPSQQFNNIYTSSPPFSSYSLPPARLNDNFLIIDLTSDNEYTDDGGGGVDVTSEFKWKKHRLY
ncbi:409_t:CDS:2 [Entrophospora sp. SA101]|nr:409_t:CDS:2 [Entrophospora sp. SA101]